MWYNNVEEHLLEKYFMKGDDRYEYVRSINSYSSDL